MKFPIVDSTAFNNARPFKNTAPMRQSTSVRSVNMRRAHCARRSCGRALAGLGFGVDDG